MLVLSRFLGISIRMYYRDHTPPHFHAIYGEHEITVGIVTGVVEGRFPVRALRMVLEWRDLRRDELITRWADARAGDPLQPIPGLE